MFDYSCDGSFIKMPTKQVAELAQQKIDWIDVYVKKNTSAYIIEKRKLIINGWWHRFYKKPIPTDEDIIKMDEDGDDWFSYLSRINNSYWVSRCASNRLLKACKYADEIYISTEDLQLIT